MKTPPMLPVSLCLRAPRGPGRVIVLPVGMAGIPASSSGLFVQQFSAVLSESGAVTRRGEHSLSLAAQRHTRWSSRTGRGETTAYRCAAPVSRCAGRSVPRADVDEGSEAALQVLPPPPHRRIHPEPVETSVESSFDFFDFISISESSVKENDSLSSVRSQASSSVNVMSEGIWCQVTFWLSQQRGPKSQSASHLQRLGWLQNKIHTHTAVRREEPLLVSWCCSQMTVYLSSDGRTTFLVSDWEVQKHCAAHLFGVEPVIEGQDT